MELRGFDSYNIRLGDEMRGERASLGKSLEQAEADLRIKAKLIVAIEECDLEGFPNPSVIAGYVRSYARYLGMDAEDCYRRFCQESGYESPSALQSTTGRIIDRKLGIETAVVSQVGAEISKSRFAAPPPNNRFRARVSLGAMTSSIALISLIAGLSYGGYALLQDIQRVGIAPLPEAPTVVADAPRIDLPDIDMQALQKPQAGDYRGGGALTALVVPTELPAMEQLRRDGPISAINPDTAGMFARLQQQSRPPAEPLVDTPDDGIMLASSDSKPSTTPPEAGSEVPTTGISLVFQEEAWIRVRESDNTTLFEGTYKSGERLELPGR
ncbi:MAG: RodZ domain-containing protein, partial [Pseudomonadota bacterium]